MYQGQANSIYDPQMAADQTQAAASRDSALSGIQSSKSDLQASYNKAFNSLQDGQNQAQARQVQGYNAAGVLNSGLATNAANAIIKDYAAQRSNLADEQGTKMANYDRQAANTQSSYQSALQSILDKYNGMKASYVQDMLNKQSDRTYQTQLANNSANLQRELAAKSEANSMAMAQLQANSYNAPAQQQTANMNKLIAGIHSAFDGYNNYKNTKMYTENNILPKIRTYATQLGIDQGQAQQLAYDFRKSQFGQ